MARSLFPSSDIIAGTSGGNLVLAPNANFTIWSARTAGTQYTDLLASDGVTALPTSGSPAKPFTDANGVPPSFYGPDGVNVPVYMDTGSGRFPVFPVDDVASYLTNGARKNVANTFSAAQSFSAGVAFTTTPTVSGSNVATQSNLGTQLSDVPTMVAFLNATGQPYVIYVDQVTGAWPNSGNRVHASGTALTGFTGRVIWDSQGYTGAAQPTGMVNGDLWDERVA